MSRGLGTGKVRNYFPAYRVFMYGVEVTALCTSVRTSWPTGTPQQCTIELVNPNNLMTLTLEDIITLAQIRERKDQRINAIYQDNADAWKSTAQVLNDSVASDESSWTRLKRITSTMMGVFAERAVRQESLDNWQNLPNAVFRTPLAIPPITPGLADVKNRVVLDKVRKGTFRSALNGPDGQKLPEETFFKHPFYQGKSIWHFGDPVSVVFRDPVDPSIWYWMHRGTITDVGEKETEDMQSVLTITSEGVLKALRNARIMNATGSILTPEVEGVSEDEFFTVLTSVPYSNFLQRMTLRGILELMIFGSQSIIDDLEERVQNGVTAEEIQERFGRLLDGPKRTDRVTPEDVSAYQQQLRNLNTTGLRFKQWKGQQGVEVGIVGGPLDDTDKQIGEHVHLFEWQRRIDNRVRVTDMGTMLKQAVNVAQGMDAAAKKKSVAVANAMETQVGQDALRDGMSIDTVITKICTDTENYPINQRVRLLMPAHLGSRLKNNIVDQELSSNISSSAEFFDRLSLIQQTLDRIEFALYDTPRGDVVVEMPLYDFEPYHFSAAGKTVLDDPNPPQAERAFAGVAWLGSVASAAAKGVFEEMQRQKEVPSEAGTGWVNYVRRQAVNEADMYNVQEGLYGEGNYQWDFSIFPFDQISVDIASSEQDVKTAFIVKPRVYPAQADDNFRTALRGEIAVALNLVPMYGIRVEQGDVYGAITSKDAARVFANIMLNRTNADTTNLRVPCLPNWAAWPNRPVWIASRNIIATVKNVAHTIAWQSDANTDYGLWHAKFWDGRITSDNGKDRMLYIPFGGVNARPFNYAYILGIRDRQEDAAQETAGKAEAEQSAAMRSGRRGDDNGR